MTAASADRFGNRHDLRDAHERQRRGGDRLSRASWRSQWDERAAAVRAAVPILPVVEAVVALKKAGNALQGACPFHDESTGSFTVYPIGGRKVPVGFFVCYGCGAKGDVIHFVMRRQGLEWTEAIQFLESENGVRLLRAAGALPKRPAVEQSDDRRKRERAERLWSESVALGAAGVVDAYLRGRAIVPPANYGVGDSAVNAGWPPDLRFHPRCWHDLEKREFPAMVAAIRGYDGALLTVHRTYLARDGAGGWTKAPVDKPKLVVGSWPPGFIRLGPDADRMLGGEGLETSLSAMQLWRRSGLCFVNSGRMKTVEPPFACTDFIYAADKGGRGGTRWGEIFAHQAAAELGHGRRVAVKIPNIAAPKGDFNDVLRARAGLETAERRSGGQAR
ncbi:MAG: hypothetical protein KIS73_24675 [Enhydrobacter sp.]|nr:hypothetical protein [Enhydrobacter sp.]